MSRVLRSCLLVCETLFIVILRVGYFTGYRECMMTRTWRMTMCDRVLIPNEKILASSAKAVPAGEVNLYPRLDIQFLSLIHI